MAGNGLAKLRLVMEIDGDKAVVTGMERVDSAVEQTARKTKTATEQMAGGMDKVSTATGRMAAEHAGHVHGMRSGWTELENQLMNVQMRIMNLTMAAALIAAPFIFAAKTSTNYLGEIETATLGIATSYMTAGKYVEETTGKTLQGHAALKSAQVDSINTVEQLKVANLQTIATLDQLIRAYQETLPVALAKGFNRDQVMSFTQAMVQAAGAIGLPFDQMGEETRSLLTGNINPRNSRIATVLGLRNEDIAQYENNAQGLFDFLMSKLEAYQVAGDAAQHTWNGLWSNFKDIVGQSGGMAFEGLFEATKYELEQITSHIITIDEKTKTIKWNSEFMSGVENVRDGVDSIVAEIYRMNMLLDKAGGSMTAFGSRTLKVAEVVTRFMTIGQFGDSLKAGSEKMAEWNRMYQERYEASDKALQAMGNKAAGVNSATGKAANYSGNPPKQDTTPASFEKFDLNSATNARLQAAQKLTEQQLSLARYASDAELAILKEKHEKGLISLKDYNDSVYSSQKAALDKEISAQETLVNQRLEQNRAANAALLKSGATEKNGVITVHTAEENRLLTQAWEAYGKATEAQTKLNDLKAKSNALDAAKPLQVYRDEVAEKKALNDATLLNIQMQLDSISSQEKLNQLTTGEAATKKIDLLQQQLNLEWQIFEQNKAIGPEADLLRLKQREAIQKTNQALLDNQDILSKSTLLGGATAALQEYARNSQEIGSQMKSAVTGWFSSMEDSLVNFIRKGKLSFRSLADSIIADLARIAIRQMITGPLAMMGTSMFGAATASAAGGAAGSGIGAGLAGAGGVGLAMSTFGGGIAAGWGAGIGAINGAGVGGMAGAGVSVGAAATVVVPIAVAAAATYIIAKFGFGMGNKWQSTGTGYDLHIGSSGEISGTTWEEFQKKGGWFTSSKYKTEYKALTDAQSINIQQAFDVIQEGLRMDAAILGNAAAMTQTQLSSVIMQSSKFKTVADFLAAYSKQVTQDLFAGFGTYAEKFHEEVEYMTIRVLPALDSGGNRLEGAMVGEDGMVEQVVRVTRIVSDGMQFTASALVRSGETVTDARTRIVSSLSTIRNFFALTGQAIQSLTYDEALQMGDKASTIISKLQAMTGGEAGKTNTALSALSAYTDSGLFTEQEKAANKLAAATLQVNTTFAALGVAIPKTNEEFKNLVNSTYAIAISGGEGSDAASTLWSQLIRLAPVFAETTAALNATTTAAGDTADALAAAAKKYNELRLQELDLLGQHGSAEYKQIIAEQRRVELLSMAESTRAIQQRVWALQDEKEALSSVMTVVTGTVDNALSAANAIKDIQGGSLSTDSPEERYRKAQAAFASATDSNRASLAKDLLTASQAYNASGSAYQSDYATVMAALQGQAGMSANSAVDKQISLLQQIKDALTVDTSPLVSALRSGTITGSSSITGIVGLQKFATGGVSYGPAIFGEAGPEAAVPLPDGRRIPVQMFGSADNRETVAELKEQNKLLRELLAEARANVRVNQAGHTGTIEAVKKSGDSRETTNKARLAAAR